MTYPNTLICKIYGLFKIEHEEISRTYFVLLMKNIAGCHRGQVRRIYDMKGSTDDRRVLKDSETELAETVARVYKDLDFIRLEHKLFISRGQVR